MDEENSDNGEKTEEPSQQRLDEFREKGIVASSREVASFLVLSTGLFVLLVSSFYSFEVMKEFLEWVTTLDYEKSFQISELEKIIHTSLFFIFRLGGPVILVSLVFGVTANVAQVGFLLAPDVLNFDLDKINPLRGIQRIFSGKTIAEFFKTLLKLVILSIVIYSFLRSYLIDCKGLFEYEIIQSLSYTKIIIIKVIFIFLIGFLILAVADYFWERFNYRKKILLTKQQAKEEAKEKEGNPETKQRIRSIQRALANRRAMNEVKKADVIVANPTHISIAIRYDKESMMAPKITAKGVDFIALKMREVAKENNVPVVENIELARNLYKNVKVGKYVPRNLYKAVAEILAYVYKLKKKEKAISPQG